MRKESATRSNNVTALSLLPEFRFWEPTDVHHGLLLAARVLSVRFVARTDDSAIDDVSAKPVSVN